jgi:hypothetical protein
VSERANQEYDREDDDRFEKHPDEAARFEEAPQRDDERFEERETRQADERSPAEELDSLLGDEIDEPVDESGEAGEDATSPRRRRRRRRGHRGREDAVLGIERMATDDMLDLDVEPMDDAETLSDLTVAREMALESSGVEPKSEGAGTDVEPEAEAEEESQEEERRGRRRRRRRGRRKGRGDEAHSTGGEHEDGNGEADDLGDDEDESAGADAETDDHENGSSRNKSLHKDVTPWVEAVGIIVSANLETRARNPGGGNRGRWKGERR